MQTLDKNLAFIQINELFNSIENENMDKGEQLNQLRVILGKLQDDSYHSGVNRGIRESVNIITEFAIDVKAKKIELD